jgi:hypothetical protein
VLFIVGINYVVGGVGRRLKASWEETLAVQQLAVGGTENPEKSGILANHTATRSGVCLYVTESDIYCIRGV